MDANTKRIIEKTHQLRQKIYKKAMDDVKLATNPLPQNLYRGTLISLGIGIVFFLTGILKLIFGGRNIFGWSTLGIGAVVIVINVISLKVHKGIER